MSELFYNAIEKRRSYYAISDEVVVAPEKIKELIAHSVQYVPTAFNSQSNRVVLLLGDKHHHIWDLTKNELKKVVPEDQFDSTAEKIDGFKAGYGTVLYFDDESVVKNLQNQFPLYAANFPVWASQSSGMLQYVIWTSLVLEGLGASLQHYNEIIEEAVRHEFDIPKEWKMTAQMPFGKPVADPAEKEFSPIEQKFKVYE